MDAEHHARGLLERSIRLATEPVDAAASERRLTRRLVTGDPRRSLEAAASGLDWLIVGARGSGPMAHLPLGSVASALAHQPITTLVVVPPHDRVGG
jgi:nucleotide-binding universal stress UspA family protein